MHTLLDEVLDYYEIDPDNFDEVNLRKFNFSEKARYNAIKAGFLVQQKSVFSLFNKNNEPEGCYRVLELEEADGTCHLFYMEIITRGGYLVNIREIDTYTI